MTSKGAVKGVLDVQVVKNQVNLVATRADGAEMRFVFDKELSESLGRQLIQAAKEIEHAKKMTFDN